MADLPNALLKLSQNLNILREREAKYAGNAPLDLLNQIEDYQKAIALTDSDQAVALMPRRMLCGSPKSRSGLGNL